MSLNGGGLLSLGASFSGVDAGLKSTLDTLSTAFDRLKKAGEAAKETMKAAGSQVAAGVEIIKGAYARFKEVDKFADTAAPLQKGLKELRLFSRATTDEVDKVRAAVLSTSTVARGFNADQAIGAIGIMAQVTGSATKAMELLNPALELAKIAGVDASVAGESLARAIKQFGLETKDASKINDVFVIGMQQYGLLTREIIPVLDTLSKSVGRVKTSFEDAALSAFIIGKPLGSIEEGANIAGAAIKDFATSSNQKVRAFVRDGRDGILSLLGAYEKLTKANPSVGLNQFRIAAQAAAGNQGAKALVTVHEELQKAAAASEGRFKTGRDVLRALRGDLKSTEGQAAQMALGLVSAQSVTKNAWQNIRTAIADPLRTAIKPIHELIARASQGILDFVNSIPQPIKQAIADFIVFGLKVMAAFGAFLALKGAIIFVFALLKGLIPLVITTGITFLVAFAPVIAQFLLAIAVFEAFKYAYETNLGGFGDSVRAAWAKIKLVWDGLMQVFSSGELSGAVLDELEKVQNRGVLEFIVWIYSAWTRLKAVWTGISEGFRDALVPLAPLFEELGRSFGKLAERLGLGSNGIVGTIAKLPFERFKEFGRTVGETAAMIVGWVLKVATVLTDLVSGIVDGVVSSFRFFSKSFGEVGLSVRGLWKALGILFEPLAQLFTSTEAGGSSWETFGKILGWIVGTVFAGLAEALSIVIDAVSLVTLGVTLLIKGLIWLGTTIGEVIGDAVNWFVLELPKAWKTATDALTRIGDAIKEIFLGAFDFVSDKFDQFMGRFARGLSQIPGLRTKFAGFIADAQRRESDVNDGFGAGARRRLETQIDNPTATPLASPGVTATEVVSAQNGQVLDTLRTGNALASQPLEVTQVLQLEGTELGKWLTGFSRDNKLTSFQD